MRLLLIFFLFFPSFLCSVLDEEKEWKRVEKNQHDYFLQLEKADLIADELFSLYPSLKPSSEEEMIELKKRFNSFLEMDKELRKMPDKDVFVLKQKSTDPSWLIRMVEDGGMTPDPERLKEVRAMYEGCRKRGEKLLAAGDLKGAAEQITMAIVSDENSEKALREYAEILSDDMLDLIHDKMLELKTSYAEKIGNNAFAYSDMRKNLPIQKAIKRMSDADFSSHSWNIRRILASHGIDLPSTIGLTITNLHIEQEIQVLEMFMANSSIESPALRNLDSTKGKAFLDFFSQDLDNKYFSLVHERITSFGQEIHNYIMETALDRKQGKRKAIKVADSPTREKEFLRMIRKLNEIMEEEFGKLDEEEQEYLESADTYTTHKLHVQLPLKAMKKKKEQFIKQKLFKKQQREAVREKDRALFLLWNPDISEEDIPSREEVEEFKRNDEL